jgi:lipid-A-disaccharide synthase
VAAAVRLQTGNWPVPVHVIEDDSRHGPAMALCRAALAASGTVTLELAMQGVPMIVAYRTHPLTAFIARRLVAVSTVTLINLVEDRQIVPEYIQGKCTADRLAEAISQLLDRPDEACAQTAAAAQALERIGRNGRAPSQRAADAILDRLGLSPPD